MLKENISDFPQTAKAINIVQEQLREIYPELLKLKVVILHDRPKHLENNSIWVPAEFEGCRFDFILRFISYEMLNKIFSLQKNDMKDKILAIADKVIFDVYESGYCMSCGSFVGTISAICFFCGNPKNYHHFLN